MILNRVTREGFLEERPLREDLREVREVRESAAEGQSTPRTMGRAEEAGGREGCVSREESPPALPVRTPPSET